MTEIKNTDDLIEEANKSGLINSQPHSIGGKKKKNNKFKTNALFSLAALLILGILGLKIYQNFFKEEHQEEVKTANDNQSQNVKARTDLGRNFDPIENTVITVSDKKTDSGNAKSGKNDGSAGNSEKPSNSGFQKYLSIPITGSGNTGNTNSSAKNESRQDNSVPSESNKSEKDNKVSKDSGMKVTSITLDPNLYIEANQVIPCALTTRFVSDVAGQINCVITADVWSANHNVKLMEKGTKAFGHYQAGMLRHGQGRIFIIWDQLRTPDFKKIVLSNTAASGALGEGGIGGWIDSHFWDRFGGAMMLSMVQDVAAAAADQAGKKDRNTDYTENSRQSLADMAKVALENSINIPPTMYRNQGDVIGILVGDDIDFSDVYELKAK
ncbi:VirB10/TraB/TrbI family type IV secretion system protein [Xenorhabdus entomophaga]|uniref:VirB10/TraB/TrbI family type IV secretion system protein n=1 Tax=Xenorhabdus entomophaga TaxID=3136257 RepID=UPI0030F37053